MDAADRDKPVIKSDTELAWPVSKVFVQGAHLIEVSTSSGWLWNSQAAGTIRIAAADNPSKVFNLLSLKSDLPIVGSTLKENRLYVLQGKSAEVIWPPWNPDTKDQPPPTTNSGQLVLSIFDVSQLPVAALLGQVQTSQDDFFGSNLDPLWVRSGLLVWVGGGSYFIPWLGGPIAARPGMGIAVDIAIGRPWWGGSGGGLFFAYDVSDPAAPAFASEVNLSTTGNWWAFSSAFTADGLVYVSHQGSEFLEGVEMPNQPTPPPTVTPDPKTGEPVPVKPPSGLWVTRYYLDVIDYADAKVPTPRKPVNIPGILRGLSSNGAVLYTVGSHWDANWNTDWSEWLDASAYDGVAASLVASVALKDWPHPLLVKDGNIFVGRAKTLEATDNPARLEVLKLDETGKFSQLSSTPLDSNASDLTSFGDLLTVQQDRQVTLFDASNPSALSIRGAGQPKGCLWYDLRNADGALERGLWIPLNEYGVTLLPVKPTPVAR